MELYSTVNCDQILTYVTCVEQFNIANILFRVEFQHKFYRGDGTMFQPFNFQEIIENREQET